jgi:hypothetical protein
VCMSVEKGKIYLSVNNQGLGAMCFEDEKLLGGTLFPFVKITG